MEPINLKLTQAIVPELQKPIGIFFKLSTSSISPERQVINYLTLNKPLFTFIVGDFVTKSLLQENFIPDLVIIDNFTQRNIKTDITLPKNHQKINTTNRAGEISKTAWLILRETCYEFKNLEKKNSINKKTEFNSKVSLKELDLNSKKTEKELKVIFVEGEEDLLVLPLIIESPIGTVICYGQPPVIGDGSQGIILIHVTEEKKNQVYNLLTKFDHVDGDLNGN